MKGIRTRKKVWLAVASATLFTACGDGVVSVPSLPAPPESNKNTAPVANAGNRVIGASNTIVFISGTRSSDAENDPLSFQWEVLSSPDGSAYSLSSETDPVARFSADLEGEYVLLLTVSDGEYESTSEAHVFIDQDGDGIVAGQDLDRDGDFVLNDDDAFPDDQSEFLDSDNDGTGNFAQKDEDGDGVNDWVDAFPLNASLSDPRIFIEEGFNDNPTDANDTGFEVPFRVGGIIETKLDGDYFTFTAEGGHFLTATCQTGSERFKPSLSIANAQARGLSTIKPAIEGSALDEGISLEVPMTGQHYLIVNDFDGQGGADFEYACHVFYDGDLDGIDDQIEIANGLNPERADSDGDGIMDAAEFYITGDVSPDRAQDIDLDGIPNWLDKDSDGDLIPDSLEGTGDADGDGLPNFLDTDSDGNGVGDLAETGVNPLRPVDTD